jgi:hypothetical protein
MSAAVTGDTLYLGPNTFDIGTGHIDLGIGGTGTVNLRGSGRRVTIIEGQRELGVGGCIIIAGTNSITEHLSIIGNAAAGVFQAPWGNDNSVGEAQCLNAVLRDVYISAASDGIYLDVAGSTATCINVVIDTGFDCIVVDLAAGPVYCYDCIFTAVADVAINGTTARPVRVELTGSLLTLLNCIINSSNGSLNNYGVWINGGICNVYGGSITTSGTGPFDLARVAGTLNVTGDTVYDTTKTSGTIVRVDAGFVQVNALSVAVSALSAVVSNRTSAILANSAQMTSANNAISAAVAALSLTHVSLVSDVGRMSLNLSALSTRADAISVLASNAQSVANAASVVAADALSAARAASANLTSVLSDQISVLRADELSLVSDVGRISVAVAAGLVSTGPVRKILAGAQLVTATALVSVSGFTFVCSAGVAYGMEFMLFTSSPISLAHPQYQFSVSGLGSPSKFMAELLFAGGPPATNATVYNSVGIRNSAMVTVSAIGVNRATRIRGGFVASAAGKLKLKVGNNISGPGVGSAITIAAGSYGYVWRMG